MFRKSISTVLALAMAVTMTFSMSGEVLAASEETVVETASADNLEVEFVDSLEEMETPLEEVYTGELPKGEALEQGVIPEVMISEANCISEEVRSGRADGISTASANNSVTVNINGTIDEENTVSYVSVTLSPGEIMQASLKLPSNENLDYDLLLYEFDNEVQGDYIKGSTLTTYMNTYPDGTKKTVDEAIAYINTDSVEHTYALIVFPTKGYSATESFVLTISLDQTGSYDASEPNESPYDVKALTTNTSIIGNNLNVPNDQDWFVIKTTGANRMGFIVNEDSYAVEVYQAINNTMRLINPKGSIYNLGDAYLYLKVYNKNIDFVKKDYILKVVTYGGIPSNLSVYFDGDMDQQQFTYASGTLYAFQYTLLPAVYVMDMYGHRVPNVDVTLEWIGDTAIGPNNGHATQTLKTDANGYVKFNLRVPRAHGIHLNGNNPYDHDTIKITCEGGTWSTGVYHMRNR